MANLRADRLPTGSQAAVSAEWSRRLRSSNTHARASELYMGRGFSLGREAAEVAGVPLFVVSAGLGLVPGAREVPTYGLTVGARADDAIAARIEGRFDPQGWWRGVRAGPFSTDWDAPFAARMIASDLATLGDDRRRRLRLFGTGIDAVLPAALAPNIMPYDARLEAIRPGTRTDFAQRALAHFAAMVRTSADPVGDADAVSDILSHNTAPVRIDRPRADDEFVIGAISRHMESTRGIGRILRRVRDHDRIACEQRRFTRLYRIAETRGLGVAAPVRATPAAGDMR